jgi:arginyl-tRNA synthetase
VKTVAEGAQPHKLCTYLFALGTAFSAFYERCPVLRAETPEQQRSRLALSSVAASVLARGLDLLGIEVPEQM